MGRGHFTRALRAGLPLIALGVALGLALSDWPIRWRFWHHHPFLTDFSAGLALLLLAGAVVEAHMDRREARRWHGLGFAASGEFASIYYDIGIALAALSGTDDGYRLRVEVEFHLAPARDRAAALLPPDSAGRAASGSEERKLDDDVLARRLEVLVADGAWRGSCSQTLRVARSHLSEAVSRWAGTFAILNDDEQFNRVTRTVTIMDMITALHMSLVAIGFPDEERGDDEAVLATLTRHWSALIVAVDAERDFWNARRQLERRVELPALLR
jgi:hypothetical protein